MYWIVCAIGVYVAAVMETSLAGALTIGGVGPDLMALVLIVTHLASRGKHALTVSFLIGLAADLTTPAHAGVESAVFLAVGWATAQCTAKLQPGVVSGIFITLVAVAAMSLISALVRQVLGEIDLPWLLMLKRSAGVAAYTAGFALPVLMVLAWQRQPAMELRSA